MSNNEIRDLLERLHTRAVRMLRLRREWAECKAELKLLNKQVGELVEAGLPLPVKLRPLAAAALEAGEAANCEDNGSEVGPST